MNKQFLKESLGWGFLLWLFGYILGFVFFFVVPREFLGWAIMPFGILATLWVLSRKIKENSIRNYILIGIVWTVIAIVCDYFLLVKVLNPPDGYYKLDVYLYYVLTLIIPILFRLRKFRSIKIA